MPNVDIPLVGPTYTSRSLPVAAQVTRGFYIEIGRESSNITSFQPFPGMKSWATIAGGTDRGMGRLDGVLYKVSGDTLYSVSDVGAETSLGTIPGTARCNLQDDNAGNLVISYGSGKPITWDRTTLTTGTDVDLPNAKTVTYIKSRVVYDGSGQNIAFADLSVPLSVNSANLSLADIKPGDIKAVQAKLSQVFAFSENAITPYYNSGTGNPPYDTIENAIQDIGLKATYSVALNSNYIYFLGSDLNVYRLAGLQRQAIGNPAIGQAIAGYANPENAIGICFSLHHQNFYYLTFPGEESWLFSEDAGWTNLAYGVSGDSHLINSYQFIYNKHLVGNRLNGNIYELDFDTFTDAGDVIIRQRDTPEINGSLLGAPDKQLTMSRLALHVETGVGLITGQGSDPQVMMQYSDDGSRTWSSERWESLGVLGDYLKPIQWFSLGSFYRRRFRFRVSDPVKVVFISLNADIEVANR